MYATIYCKRNKKTSLLWRQKCMMTFFIFNTEHSLRTQTYKMTSNTILFNLPKGKSREHNSVKLELTKNYE